MGPNRAGYGDDAEGLTPLSGTPRWRAALSPTAWALAAAASAVVAPALTVLGAPGAIAHIHFALAGGALALGVIRRRKPVPRIARDLLLALGALAAVVALSAVINSSEPIRPLFGYALLVEPFVIAAALVLGGWEPGLRRAVLLSLVGWMLLQVPLVIYQLLVVAPRHDEGLTAADYATGTLVDVTSGAHIIGLLAVVAAAVVLRAPVHPRLKVLALALLLPLPILTDTKIAFFALPVVGVATLLLTRASARLVVAAVAGSVLVVVASLTVPALSRGYASDVVTQVLGGEGGKVNAADLIGEELSRGPEHLLLGIGPAESVSHAAFLTIDPLRKADSPVEALDLEPARVARLFKHDRNFVGTFESPRSSAIGVVGDYGVLGLLTYLGLALYALVGTRASRWDYRTVAVFALLLMIVLGPLGEWWEQGHLTAVIGVLVGMALAEPLPSDTRSSSP